MEQVVERQLQPHIRSGFRTSNTSVTPSLLYHTQTGLIAKAIPLNVVKGLSRNQHQLIISNAPAKIKTVLVVSKMHYEESFHALCLQPVNEVSPCQQRREFPSAIESS